jgi:hypothetical protein
MPVLQKADKRNGPMTFEPKAREDKGIGGEARNQRVRQAPVLEGLFQFLANPA